MLKSVICVDISRY